MKFVLRNKHTGRYLRRAGHWVTRLDDAMTFGDMTEVREYCQAHRLENVQPIRWWAGAGALLRAGRPVVPGS